MEIHNCIHCGTEAQPSWRFCRRCGTGLADLEQAPRVAQCSNCAAGLADGWRFCPNCATSTESATSQEGMSEDDVADLIPTPEPDTSGFLDQPVDTGSVNTEPLDTAPMDTAPTEPVPLDTVPMDTAPTDTETLDTVPMDTAPTDTMTMDTAPTQLGVDDESIEFEAAPIEPTTEIQPTFEEPEAEVPAEPVISAPVVSFESAVSDFDESAAVGEPLPPAGDLDFLDKAPAPPLDAMATIAEIEARIAADRAPAPPDDSDDTARPEIVEESRGFDWDTTPVAEDDVIDVPAAPPLDSFDVHPGTSDDGATDRLPEIPGFDETPAVVIPSASAGDRPPIPTEIPTPIGTPRQPITEIPQPLRAETESTWTPTTAEPAAQAQGELPPVDRLFSDPGLFGQATQLALLLTAAISVAMVVAHIVLNNRLTDFATTGESVPRVESVQSIIGTWLRPILILAVVGVFFMAAVWGRRVVANLAVFGKPVPEAAPWMWAIPLVNILVIHRHFDTAWKGSDVLLKDDRNWQKTRGDWWTLGFAALSIVTVGVLFYGSVVHSIDVEGATGSISALKATEGAIDSNAFLMIGYAFLGAASLCLVRSISGIIERQHNRARHYV